MARALPSLRRRRRERLGDRRRRPPDRARGGAARARVGRESWVSGVRDQSVFHASQFALPRTAVRASGNRLGVAYLHGRPGNGGHAGVRHVLRGGTHTARGARPDPGAVGRDGGARAGGRRAGGEGVPHPASASTSSASALRTPDDRAEARAKLGLPEDAFVAGSFQKDGVGWDEGLEPKLIKGPGRAARGRRAAAPARRPSCGCCSPAPPRGYVKQGLERMGVPYRHLVRARPGRRREGVPRARRLSRHLARRGRAEGGAGGDGDRASRS